MDNGFISATYTVSISLYSGAIRTKDGYPVIKEGEKYSTQNYQMKGNSSTSRQILNIFTNFKTNHYPTVLINLSETFFQKQSDRTFFSETVCHSDKSLLISKRLPPIDTFYYHLKFIWLITHNYERCIWKNYMHWIHAKILHFIGVHGSHFPLVAPQLINYSFTTTMVTLNCQSTFNITFCILLLFN